MRISALAFFRALFLLLSVILMLGFAMSTQSTPTAWTYGWGAGLGLFIGILFIAGETFFKQFNLKSLNIATLGLFLGYLMALACVSIFNAVIQITNLENAHPLLNGAKIFIFLAAPYVGVMLTLRASDEIYVSIPFIKFTPSARKTKDILVDLSALSDPRLIDLASSGLIDKRLVLPRFLLKTLHQQAESADESAVYRAKKALEVVKKLEILPTVGLRYQDTDFREIKELQDKVFRLARFLNTDILSAESSQLQMPHEEGIKIINLHALSNALKPLMQKGESIKIKIQRYGKEEHQGVGYLEDGTMVVVNGGGDFIGDTLLANVLSLKHTSSGRMLFCNVANESV